MTRFLLGALLLLTSSQSVNFFSLKQDVAIGTESSKEAESSLQLIRNTALNQYIALIAQGVWSVVLTLSGRYDELYTYVIFIGVLFYVLTVGALFILRWKRPYAERPYRCTGYPWTAGLYMLVSLAWALVVLLQRPKEAIAGIVIVALGVPAYLYFRSTRSKTPA